MVTTPPSAEPPADELTRLRAEVAELRAELQLVNAVVDALPYGVFWKGLDLVYRGCNLAGLHFSRVDRSAYVGHTDFDLWPRDQAEAFQADDREVLASRQPKPHIVEQVTDASGQTNWVETHKAPVFGPDGELLGLVGSFRDVSQQKQAEEAIRNEQRDALQAMATPLLPVADGVVVLPIIGALDPERAEQVMHALLEGIVHHRARVAILDITGLQSIDTAAADGLVRAARAIRLLGAETIITGVRAAVAQTLVTLGTGLGDIVALGDLKAGIAHAIAGRSAG